MKRALFVLAGSSILAVAATVGVSTQAQTPAAASGITFHKDVALILNNHCVSCHRPGEIGPMSFLSYETTRPWARSIKDKVVKREMPPWAADPHASMKFRNDRSLSQQQIDTIAAWSNAGAPRGNPADAPPAPTFASGWQLGEPDFVFEQPIEWTVKPDAQEPYLYFYEKIPFSEDKWAAGVPNRYSNANGLGNPLGGKFGLYRRGDQSFLYGALVGSLDGGKTFFSVGTHLSMTVLTEGTLTLHYWDSNSQDNVGDIAVIVQIYTGPINVSQGQSDGP